MIPVAVTEAGKTLRHPHYVQTKSFALMKDLSACQRSRLGNHVNSTVTVRNLPNSGPFHLHLCFLDSCQAPSDFKNLKETTGLGRNVNGSVCLNFVCQCVF